MWYFAYGANTHRGDMARRCPASVARGVALLPRHRFVYRGGLAHLEEAPGALGAWGVLWAVTPRCLEALDAFEGYPTLYDRRRFWVQRANGQGESAWLYLLQGEVGDGPPQASYHQTLLTGYHQFGLDPAPVVAAHLAARQPCQSPPICRGEP